MNLQQKLSTVLTRTYANPISILTSAQYKTTPITKEMFITITPNKLQSKVFYVDGGNATLINGSQIHISAAKVAIVLEEINLPALIVTEYNFIVLLTRVADSNNYAVDLFASDDFTKKMCEESAMGQLFIKDCSLDDFTGENQLESLSSHVRRLLELFIAAHAISKTPNCVVVLDGTLKSHTAIVDHYLNRLYSTCKGSICAVSKTSKMMLNSGESILTYARKTPGMWYLDHAISSVTQSHKALITFVSLHPQSKYVFRLDFARSSVHDIADVLGHLAYKSTDSVFYGYPYPLIRVDNHARISDSQKLQLKTQILMQLDTKTQQLLKADSASVDAHDVLDSLKF